MNTVENVRRNIIYLSKVRDVKFYASKKNGYKYKRKVQEFVAGRCDNISFNTIQELAEKYDVDVISLVYEKDAEKLKKSTYKKQDILEIIRINLKNAMKSKGFTKCDKRFKKKRMAVRNFVIGDVNTMFYNTLESISESLGVKIKNLMTEGYYG